MLSKILIILIHQMFMDRLPGVFEMEKINRDVYTAGMERLWI